jgi:hypothetical protein
VKGHTLHMQVARNAESFPTFFFCRNRKKCLGIGVVNMSLKERAEG